MHRALLFDLDETLVPAESINTAGGHWGNAATTEFPASMKHVWTDGAVHRPNRGTRTQAQGAVSTIPRKRIKAGGERDLSPRVLVVVHNGLERARLDTNLQGKAVVDFCADGDELLRRAQMTGLDLAVLEIAGEPSVAGIIHALHEQFPGARAIAYVQAAYGMSTALTLACSSGADAFVVAGYDDLSARVATLLSESGQHRACREAMARFTSLLPSSLLGELSYCFNHVHDALTVDALAEASHVSRKTLLHRFSREGWPPPSVVIAWTKLLVAAHHLSHSGRTMDSIAGAVGLPSGTSLRLTLKRYANASPQQVKRGGMNAVLPAFMKLIDSSRRDHKQQ